MSHSEILRVYLIVRETLAKIIRDSSPTMDNSEYDPSHDVRLFKFSWLWNHPHMEGLQRFQNLFMQNVASDPDLIVGINNSMLTLERLNEIPKESTVKQHLVRIFRHKFQNLFISEYELEEFIGESSGVEPRLGKAIHFYIECYKREFDLDVREERFSIRMSQPIKIIKNVTYMDQIIIDCLLNLVPTSENSVVLKNPFGTGETNLFFSLDALYQALLEVDNSPIMLSSKEAFSQCLFQNPLFIFHKNLVRLTYVPSEEIVAKSVNDILLRTGGRSSLDSLFTQLEMTLGLRIYTIRSLIAYIESNSEWLVNDSGVIRLRERELFSEHLHRAVLQLENQESPSFFQILTESLMKINGALPENRFRSVNTIVYLILKYAPLDAIAFETSTHVCIHSIEFLEGMVDFDVRKVLTSFPERLAIVENGGVYLRPSFQFLLKNFLVQKLQAEPSMACHINEMLMYSHSPFLDVFRESQVLVNFLAQFPNQFNIFNDVIQWKQDMPERSLIHFISRIILSAEQTNPTCQEFTPLMKIADKTSIVDTISYNFGPWSTPKLNKFLDKYPAQFLNYAHGVALTNQGRSEAMEAITGQKTRPEDDTDTISTKVLTFLEQPSPDLCLLFSEESGKVLCHRSSFTTKKSGVASKSDFKTCLSENEQVSCHVLELPTEVYDVKSIALHSWTGKQYHTPGETKINEITIASWTQFVEANSDSFLNFINPKLAFLNIDVSPHFPLARFFRQLISEIALEPTIVYMTDPDMAFYDLLHQLFLITIVGPSVARVKLNYNHPDFETVLFKLLIDRRALVQENYSYLDIEIPSKCQRIEFHCGVMWVIGLVCYYLRNDGDDGQSRFLFVGNNGLRVILKSKFENPNLEHGEKAKVDLEVRDEVNNVVSVNISKVMKVELPSNYLTGKQENT